MVCWRRAFPGRAFQLTLLLHLGRHPALATAPAKDEGGGCQAADETSRLRCQLDEAKALVSRQRSVIEEKIAELELKQAMIKEKDIELARRAAAAEGACNIELEWKAAIIAEKDVELEWKEALIVEKDIELARREAVVKDLEARLARKEVQDEDTSLDQMDALIKEPEGFTADAREQPARTEAQLASERSPTPHTDRHGRLLDGTTDLLTIIAELPINTTNIDLSSSGLAGTLPAELGQLIHLESLDLSGNSLTGTIPPELGKLTQLRQLSLRNNQLTDTLPAELGRLVHLEQLDLSSNRIAGTIPPEVGQLSQLTHLSLNTNLLTGTLPAELGRLIHLKYMELWGNSITGTIPPELGNLMQLRQLSLRDNLLTGTLPPEVGMLTRLYTLHIFSNRLEGTLPTELGNLTKLIEMSLQGNRLTGTIPQELGTLVRLQVLQLHSNQLSGTIPSEFGNLTSLTTLNLASNQLAGTIPPELGNLTQLQSLYLMHNKVTGKIPPDLGQLTHLNVLDLQGNLLTGSIPPDVGELWTLYSLRLNDNRLTGTIAPKLSNLMMLAELALNGNLLAGTLPAELGNLLQLTLLYLGNNQITGTIPPELGNLTRLMELQLNTNLLAGTIPPEIGKMSQLKALDLHDNLLTGTLPKELGSLVVAKSLDLSSNGFGGTLPEVIVHIEALLLLDVSNNPGLTGTFPDTRTSNLLGISAANCSFTSAGAVGAAVRMISFASNKLTELPAEWVNLPRVRLLDVSNNNISVWRPYGVLPSSVFVTWKFDTYPMERRLNWPVIQSLKLSGNPFGPNIATRDFIWSLAYLTSLSELSAAGCQLQGEVPLEVAERTGCGVFGGTFGVDMESTGTWNCSGLPDQPAPFKGLLTLDLSDNSITSIMPPPPNRLYVADLHSNPLSELNVGWYTMPNILEVWNNSFLRVSVTPPSRESGCLNGGAQALEADPRGFATQLGEDAFQCTTLCAGVTTRYKHDASLNVSALCRCTEGRQGVATNCTGCPADTYSAADDVWAMVRTCRPCPERSSTDYAVNATKVGQCKCHAGWYMESPPTAGDGTATATPACKRCKQGVFMDTLPGATQEAQCICNPSYAGLRAVLGICGCADGLYMDQMARECRRCDTVAEECAWGSQIDLSLLPPVVKASYWAAPPPEVGPDGVSTFSKHDIWRCFSKDTCLGNGRCAIGRSGTACSLCAEGMYGGPDGPCKPCPYSPEDARKNLLYGLIIGPAATIAAHTVLNLRADKLASALASARTSAKQSLKYLQMLGVMAGFNIGWPPLAIQFLTEVSRVTVALPQVAGFACLTGRQTATVEMGCRWLMPVAGLLSACLGALLVAPIRFLGRKSRCFELVHMSCWDVLRVSLWGLALFYSTLLQYGTQVLACTEGPNGRRTVVTFPHLSCGESDEWAQLAVISGAFLLVFVGAVFLGVYAAWRRATHTLVESNFASSGWWGFLFEDYRDGWGHWLMATMAKDAALVVIASAGASDGPSQLLATAALSTAYSYIVLRDQPFQNPSNNVVEAWTMMSVAVLSVFTAGMGFQSAPGVADVMDLFGDGASDPEYKKRERALFVVECLTFVGPAGIMLYQLLCASEKVRQWLPACLRPATQEEHAQWNRHFIGSLRLDQATAADLWRVMDRLDVVDNARFRHLMSTSTATLGIVPSSARGLNMQQLVRKRFSAVAKASQNNRANLAGSSVLAASEDQHQGEGQPQAAAVEQDTLEGNGQPRTSSPVKLQAVLQLDKLLSL